MRKEGVTQMTYHLTDRYKVKKSTMGEGIRITQKSVHVSVHGPLRGLVTSLGGYYLGRFLIFNISEIGDFSTKQNFLLQFHVWTWFSWTAAMKLNSSKALKINQESAHHHGSLESHFIEWNLILNFMGISPLLGSPQFPLHGYVDKVDSFFAAHPRYCVCLSQNLPKRYGVVQR